MKNILKKMITLATILTIAINLTACAIFEPKPTPTPEITPPDRSINQNDYGQTWEKGDKPFEANLLINPKCDIIYITYTIDFYDETKEIIIRTITDKKENLKKNKKYSFKYEFELNEKRCTFTRLSGEVDPYTRDIFELGSN